MDVQSESVEAAGETIIVVNNAKCGKGSTEALDWAINHVVRPKDTVIFLGVLSEVRKKSSASCFPFHVGIGIPGISAKLEQSQGEMSPGVLEEEIEEKREEYQHKLQPFYRQCMKSEVNLEVKIAAGFDPRKITVEEAHKCNPRWIVLDSNLKKEKVYIYGHVACNVAIMKRKGIATLMPSRDPECGQWLVESHRVEDLATTVTESEELQYGSVGICHDKKLSIPATTPQCPCWHQLSWGTGFPRAFSFAELEVITNGFSNENVVSEEEGQRTYEGILMQTPVLITCYSGDDDRFWPLLKLFSRVRHQNIVNLIGYCCTSHSMFLLYAYPCSGSLEMNLKDDESSKNLSWTTRWNIALEIGEGLCYLQEECYDEPVVNIPVSSTEVVYFHGSSAKICLFKTSRWFKDCIASDKDSSAQFPDMKEHLLADIRAYGMFLIEIITGKSRQYSQKQALALFEDSSLSEVIDNRLADTRDAGLVHNLAHAALLCLKSDDWDHELTMSKVLAVIRGDQVARTNV